jgi:hypothetical protein
MKFHILSAALIGAAIPGTVWGRGWAKRARGNIVHGRCRLRVLVLDASECRAKKASRAKV